MCNGFSDLGLQTEFFRDINYISSATLTAKEVSTTHSTMECLRHLCRRRRRSSHTTGHFWWRPTPIDRHRGEHTLIMDDSDNDDTELGSTAALQSPVTTKKEEKMSLDSLTIARTMPEIRESRLMICWRFALKAWRRGVQNLLCNGNGGIAYFCYLICFTLSTAIFWTLFIVTYLTQKTL